MHLRILALLPLFLQPILSCNHANMARATDNTSLPLFIPGNDGLAEEVTRGYFINHVSLIVSNITASRQWYSDVLGMRHVFTFQMTKQLSIMYMAHAQGGRNGTGFQTGDELIRDKNNLAGMVEFLENKVPNHFQSKYRKFNPTAQNTFSHMGLIVPDLAVAQARFDALGVNIIKRANELDVTPSEANTMFASAWGYGDLHDPQTQKDVEEALPAIMQIGFKGFIIIADPDGNVFEVQSLVPSAL
ncbi:hypothetical protein EJ04DRAFT_442557 [Polyplosphaeria fusca]|uniref:VOC domain-containing protein n=1 Tax=Polyplosphaeria fusca TaxID=682080 RepID=A0A9P4QV66_9PLEO|nr:hypothetical protein EJ04DRAFT_442557 [Polyplosphaeria fusca]